MTTGSQGSWAEGLPYRPCVGVTLVNRAGLVFIGRRAGGIEHVDESHVWQSSAGPEHVDDTHAWQMPQGGIDPGEEPLHAAMRELHEETNVRSATLLAEAPDWYGYDLPAEISGRAWRGRYRGQMQRWFAFRFTGPDSEINILRPADGRHKPEFDAWRWATLDELPALIIPFKRPVYEQVVSVFRDVATPEVTSASGVA